MNESREISIGIKWIGVVILAIIIAFFSSRLIVEFINEFLRSNWQYSLFEDNESTIIFANCIMISILIVEVIFVSIFYKNRKIDK
ncbi:hypothetical protein [[Clostridium] dakarense]|uniref:hypothetical protein n=1 Tax=Faecalimicrobium dakarense TaxID=1301100 RepID=UPI0004B7CFCD|nr:hypothetical protein [[Clostridium] dakarense]